MEGFNFEWTEQLWFLAADNAEYPWAHTRTTTPYCAERPMKRRHLLPSLTAMRSESLRASMSWRTVTRAAHQRTRNSRPSDRPKIHTGTSNGGYVAVLVRSAIG